MFMTLFSSFLTKARLYVCNPSNSLRSRQIEANWNLFSTFSASFCLWMIEYRCDLRTRIAERERHTHRDRETSMSARNGVWVNRKLLFEFGQRDIQNKEWIRMTPKENKPDGTRQFSEKTWPHYIPFICSLSSKFSSKLLFIFSWIQKFWLHLVTIWFLVIYFFWKLSL